MARQNQSERSVGGRTIFTRRPQQHAARETRIYEAFPQEIYISTMKPSRQIWKTSESQISNTFLL